MEGRGSLRQLHQQLASASSYANLYTHATAPDWQTSGGYGSHHRPPPPLPSLPPWAANASVSSSGSHSQARHHAVSQQPQPHHLVRPSLGGQLPNSRLHVVTEMPSREELDASTADGRESERGWRKAPSFFESMKRLPFHSGASESPAMHPDSQPHPLQFPQLGSTAAQSRESELLSTSKRDHQVPCDGPEQQERRQWPPQQQRNQQQEAEGEDPEVHQVLLAPIDEGVLLVNQHEESTGATRVQPATNQTEEDPQQHHQPLPSHPCEDASPPAAVVQQSGGFFRPWKKSSLSSDSMDRSNNNLSGSGDLDSPGDTQANKWTKRALLNPFARQRTKASKPSSSAPALVPCTLSGDGAATAKDDELPQHQQESPLPPMAPRRPITPLPAPSALRSSTRPASLGSRGAVAGISSDGEPSAYADAPVALSEDLSVLKPSRRSVKASNQLQDGPSQMPEVPTNYYNREEREDFQSFKTPVPKQHPTPQSAVRGRAKPVPPQSQAALSREPPKPSTAKPPKPKGAVLSALAEIQRKRDERRSQQAEEKQRLRSELEAHGDDTGYKFRRLIQAYRDALPAFQRTEKTASELPRITGSAAAQKSASAASVGGLASSRLSVFVRKRPLSKKELKAKGYDIVSCLYAVVTTQTRSGALKSSGEVPDGLTHRQELILHEPKLRVDCSEALENHTFRFDGVFDELQDNAHVYSCSVGPLIPFLIHDRLLATRTGSHANLTVFAYGQTGSGKTYTMKAVYRQAASDLFERLDAICGAGRPVLVGVSFYEIYMNNVNDLLNGRSRLQLMEDGEGTVQLLGLKEVMIASADELLELVKHGEDSRATSANAVHDDSSRSHALLRITLYPNATSSSSVILARLSMVDLAGSERACDTQSDRCVGYQ